VEDEAILDGAKAAAEPTRVARVRLRSFMVFLCVVILEIYYEQKISERFFWYLSLLFSGILVGRWLMAGYDDWYCGTHTTPSRDS
jgi:hypothetical protein